PPRHYTLFPYTTLFRSRGADAAQQQEPPVGHVPDHVADFVEGAGDESSRGPVPQHDRDAAGPIADAAGEESEQCVGHGLLEARKDRKSTRLNSSHVSIS